MNINFSSIKNFWGTVGKLFWKKIFLFFFLFLFLDFLFAGILLIKYYFKSSDYHGDDSLMLLDQNLLNNALNHWKAEQAIIKKLPDKQYPDFFQDFSASSPAAPTSSE
ncbi:hypothetical protein COT20_00680 [bacterium (Candidatus Gribaldobacteria) CG08_land_8_20_14_0_20_39_15]|uniref:Uncharacterized protein n=1 Tax=bacterium (Candidatus Gribaldobacteria) CG08_land_8_20_14_0_20_39_15 TaxID=2014273 RepID=A0A2M6XV86_9BACT|nr:MAG: hypothetical protein COT20_00680 [bacterium (Candidatus Gribaldobacteria) CG08_land_8_20_14_0_20_39_15]